MRGQSPSGVPAHHGFRDCGRGTVPVPMSCRLPVCCDWRGPYAAGTGWPAALPRAAGLFSADGGGHPRPRCGGHFGALPGGTFVSLQRGPVAGESAAVIVYAGDQRVGMLNPADGVLYQPALDAAHQAGQSLLVEASSAKARAGRRGSGYSRPGSCDARTRRRVVNATLRDPRHIHTAPAHVQVGCLRAGVRQPYCAALMITAPVTHRRRRWRTRWQRAAWRRWRRGR